MNSTEKTSTKTQIALVGSTGKMGQKILELARSEDWSKQVEIVYEISSQTNPENLNNPIDGVIDFSSPESTLKWSQHFAQSKTPYLVCSTGFKAEQFAELKSHLKNQAWSFIPNTSLGIFAFIRCVCGLIAFFKDIKSLEIHDIHHVHKKDSPSGTALLIQAAVVDALNKRQLSIPAPIKSAREGEVVGVHSVILQRAYDRLILTHEAFDRKLFAEGALSLLQKLSQKNPREKPYTFDELL